MSGSMRKSPCYTTVTRWAFLSCIAALLQIICQSAPAQAQTTPADFGLSHPSPYTGGQADSFLSTSPLRLSASADWQTYPLYAGEMTSIAAHPVLPQVVYVGTRDAGVFKTADSGETWQPAHNGLTFYPIRSLLIDPQNPNILYAGTDFDGVWKSSDDGGTWADFSSGLDKSLIVFNIAIDPQDSDTLYVGMAGGIGLYIGHIYKSEDAGATWALQDTGLPIEAGDYTNGIFSLAVDPVDALTVYAGTNYRGAYRSTNGGESWEAINQGLPFQPGSDEYREAVNALAIDPHHGNRLSAIIGGQYHIFEGEQWQLINDDMYDANSGLFTDYLYFHPTDASTIYSAGDSFKISTNEGITWTQQLGWPDSGQVPGIAFHPSTPDTIYAATNVLFDYEGGVYKSIDQGDSWSEAWQGITAPNIYSVEIDPQDSHRIYASTGDGFLYYSSDGGATWDRGYYLINPEPYQQKIFSFGAVSDVAVDPADPHKVYLAGTNFYTSTNYGEVFYDVEAVEYPTYIAIAPDATSTVYVGTSFGGGIFKSVDGGLTWLPVNEGLPEFGDMIAPILSIAVDPTDTTTVWAGTQYGGGILKSTNGGELWEVKGLTETNFVDAIAINPLNSNILLVGAGFSDGGIYKTEDGGESWEVKVSGIAFVMDIVYDPRNPLWVYAATEGYGVLRSLDGGESWQFYSDGIFYPLTYSLAITQEDPPLLIAGSYGSGLYSTYPLRPTLTYLPAVMK